jgi:GNAT superfamily N-acetyltransferase
MGPVLVARRLERGDLGEVLGIVRGLPDHFPPDVPATVERQAAEHLGWVLTDGSHVVGFALAAIRSLARAEMTWMAVAAHRRGRGAGSVLLGAVLDGLAAAGIRVVEAKTPVPRSPSSPHEATRAFWERRGFVHVDTVDPSPGRWPRAPVAVCVAALAPTR